MPRRPQNTSLGAPFFAGRESIDKNTATNSPKASQKTKNGTQIHLRRSKRPSLLKWLSALWGKRVGKLPKASPNPTQIPPNPTQMFPKVVSEEESPFWHDVGEIFGDRWTPTPPQGSQMVSTSRQPLQAKRHRTLHRNKHRSKLPKVPQRSLKYIILDSSLEPKRTPEPETWISGNSSNPRVKT